MGQSRARLTTFADLLAPVSTPEFLEVFRARKRLHVAASDLTRAEALFSWRDIDTVLSAHMLDDSVTLMRDGVRIPRQLYTSNEGKWLNVRAFHDLLPQGISIVVDHVERWVPQIRQLATAVEREMGIRTGVNAYLSFSRGGALKPHWDTHDVLIVQVHGNKRWHIWNAEVPHPIDLGKFDARVAPDQEVEMAPGDLLFIPRGEPHAAAVSAKHSVHLTISLLSKTGLDFFDHLRNEAAKDPLLRMDLPRHSSDEKASAHEAAVKHSLHRLIDAAGMSQFLREDDLRRVPAPQTAVSGALPQMDDFLRLTLASPYSDPSCRLGRRAAAYCNRRRGTSHFPSISRRPSVAFRSRPGNVSRASPRIDTALWTGLFEASILELLRFGFVAIVNPCTDPQ